MGMDAFVEHAERARHGQWAVDELPWDEPLEFCGANLREQTICKLDMLDVAEAMYHLELGARVRMGDFMLRSWSADAARTECVEWHDADEQRHVRVLRRLIDRLTDAGEPVPARTHKASPKRMWRVACSSRDRLSNDTMLLNMLVDEAVCKTLYEALARRSHIPLIRATYAACAADEDRHMQYLLALCRARLREHNGLAASAMQARVVAHVAQVQSAFRPYLGSFAGACHSTPESVASEIFRAVSHVLSDLGPKWQRSPVTRLVHTADRSPWLIWLLR